MSSEESALPDPGEGPAALPGAATTYVVGLGASAGGLEALEAFFDHTPPDTGLVFVVIQHLSPDYKSLMVELLSRHTKMPVVRARDGVQVEANTVYLIPPKTDMTLSAGRLRLREHDPGAGIHLPIDIFFRSLAEDCGERAVGIVLSGTGSDGMRGVRAIKDAGGMVMVQDETEAKFDGMPRSAMSTGLVDFVLPVAQMPAELITYIRACCDPPEARVSSAIRSDEENLLRIAEILRRHTGVDFAHYKPATIVRRLERRMGINQATTLDEYIQVLERVPRERTVLCKELLIGVTKFFRDTEAFGLLETEVIPAILENVPPTEPIRVWAPACSTGEEAYSLAMMFLEVMDKRDTPRELKLFATDIDREAVEFAAAGLYPESIVADVPADRLAKYFTRHGDHYQVNRALRETVVFAIQNLAKDPPLTRMDMVSCRNLLIYLQPVLQKKVLSLLAYALKARGFLFLGPSETAGSVAHLFKTHSAKWKIYRSVSGDRRSLAEALANTGGRSFGLPTVSSRPERSSETETVLEKVYQELMDALDLRCIVLDEEHRVVHSFGNVSDLVQLRPGKASLDLVQLVPRELATPLRSALARVQKEHREIAYEGIELKSSERWIDLRVRPLTSARDERGMYIVFFSEQHRHGLTELGGEAFEPATRTSEDRIAHLEQELQYTKENLQATIEELETSNEELQATNEELLAANEELQSTNEELQSVNEELQTVNGEYQQKIEELSQLNYDVENLLRVTGIGMVFVDDRLQIRKFTPAATRLLSLLPMDVGRPIDHISTRGIGIDLAARAQAVLRFGSTHEEPIKTPDGSHFIARLVPYLVEGGEPQGVVVHFIDVTNFRRTQEWFEHVLDSLRSHVAVLDTNGMITFVNAGWRRFAAENGNAELVRSGIGTNYIEACEAAANAGDEYAQRARDGIRAILDRRVANFALEYPCHAPDGGQRWFSMNATRLEDPSPGALVWHLEVTPQILGE